MNQDEFLKNITNAIERTAEELKPTMEAAALTAKALLTRRIQSSGFGKKYTSRSYARFRASKGYETRFVNLTFTGDMFRGWKRPGNFRIGLKVGGTVGGTNIEAQNKLRWNKSRYPDFDRITDEEKNLLAQKLIKPEIAQLLQKNLLSR